MSLDLGIKTDGLSKGQIDTLEKSVGSLIDLNRTDANAQIQRRGENLPGDIGNNFGQNRSDLGGLGLYSEFDSISRQFGGGQHGFNGSYLSLYGIQGSNVALSRTTKLAHHKMGLCVSAYKGFGVAKNVIDLMANFAAEGLAIKHANPTVERFYKRWAEHVDLGGRVKDILRYYYKYGNVFVYTTNGVIDKHSYDRMRRARAKINQDGTIPGFMAIADSNDPESDNRIKDAEDELKKSISEREIPWRYTLLNPFQMELRGSKFFGDSRWVFVLDEDTASKIKSNRLQYRSKYIDFLDESSIGLPPEFADLSQRLTSEAPENEQNDLRVADLDQKRLWTMHYMKDDHEDWADPLLWPVMADVFYKNKLRQMDISVCDSVINAVTIFKLGNLEEGYIASTEAMSRFAEFLRTPTYAMNMVWNDSIDIVDSYPPVDKILGLAKYESVDRDILRGIGVPDTLLGGGGSSNFSTGFLGVRTLLERLEEGRNVVIRWIKRQLQLIATIMGHRKLPDIRFGKMSLRDEKAEKQLVLGLLDRNIISIQSVLECFGENFEIEIQRMRDEQKIREKEDILVQHGPYTDPMATLTDEEAMDKEQNQAEKLARIKMEVNKMAKKKEGKGINRPNGRPPGTKGVPQQNKRETKPKGMAFVEYEKARQKSFELVESIEKVVATFVLKSKGKKTKRSLTKHESAGIEAITFVVASHFDSDKVSFITVTRTLELHKQMDDGVFANYEGFKTDNMSLEDRKLAMASAIAIKKVEG